MVSRQPPRGRDMDVLEKVAAKPSRQPDTAILSSPTPLPKEA